MAAEQLHAGKLKGTGGAAWHNLTDDPTTYWCGNWGNRSAAELYLECRTVLEDLRRNHPGIEQQAAALAQKQAEV